MNIEGRNVDSLSDKVMQTSKNSQLSNSFLFFSLVVAVCFKASDANGEAQLQAKTISNGNIHISTLWQSVALAGYHALDRSNSPKMTHTC